MKVIWITNQSDTIVWPTLTRLIPIVEMGLTFNVWHCYFFCFVSWSAVVESHGARNQKTASTLFRSSGEIYNKRWRKNEHPVWSYKLRSTGCDKKYRPQKWKVFQSAWSREWRKADDSSVIAAFRWTHKHNLRKQPTFAMPPLVSPRNDVWETSAEIPYWWRFTTQILVVLLIGCAPREICFNQSAALPRSG